MKYIYLILLTLAVLCGKSQDTTFNRLLYSTDRTKGVSSIVRNDSNYYILYGNVNVNPYKVGYGLLKLNDKYEVIDSSVYESINNYVGLNNGKGFIQDKSDTSIVLSGFIQFPNNQVQNGYLIKFNKNLDTLWTKQIMHPDTAYADTAQTPWVVLRDIEITPDGNYIIVGNYNHHCQGNMDRNFIIKMDTSGNILWYKFLDPNIYQAYITNIEIDPLDSGFYFISAGVDFYLYKYNKNGDLLWSKQFYSGNKLIWVTDIKLIGNNIIIGFTYIIFSGDAPRLQVASLDRNNHSINWIKKFSTISIESKYLRQEVIKVEEMPNGNIAVGSVGMKYKDSTFYYDIRANLLMLNPNGDSLWSHYYTYQNDSWVEDMQFNDMVVCDDGGILFGGSYYSYINDPQFIRAWLVKTDSLGNAPGMFTVGIEEEELVIKNYELRIYPNPTSDIVNLSMEESPKKDLQLEVYNISGQLVLEKQLPVFQKVHRLNIQYLQSGIYLIKLSSDNKLVYSGKFVKE